MSRVRSCSPDTVILAVSCCYLMSLVVPVPVVKFPFRCYSVPVVKFDVNINEEESAIINPRLLI